MKVPGKLTPRGNSLAVTLPRDVIVAAGLSPGDGLVISVHDQVIEIRHAATAETILEYAFTWVMGRYGQTLRDLSG
jgi:antitoxin component of MazEF toxin-antitoxin module